MNNETNIWDDPTIKTHYNKRTRKKQITLLTFPKYKDGPFTQVLIISPDGYVEEYTGVQEIELNELEDGSVEFHIMSHLPSNVNHRYIYEGELVWNIHPSNILISINEGYDLPRVWYNVREYGRIFLKKNTTENINITPEYKPHKFKGSGFYKKGEEEGD